MANRRPKGRSAAVVTIRRASRMTPERKRDIANWLRRTATSLLHNGDQYAPRFTARYIDAR